MKLLYPTLLLCSLTSYTLAAPVIRATANGRWSQAGTWNLSRQPQSGDTVLVPANIEIVLDFNESLNNIVLKITGTLRLNNGKLNLNAASRIQLMAQGRLSGNGNNDQVRIGGDFKFRGGIDQSILGPAYADTSTGVSPHGFNGGFSLLNATLTDYTVNKVNNEVHVAWVSVPGNTLRFEVEKSFNGSTWNVIGTIMISGDPNVSKQYLYIDKHPGTTVYYRIRQVFAATIAYTSVKVVTAGHKPAINIYSASQLVRVRFDQPASFPVKIMVADMSGRLMRQLSYQQPGMLMDFRMNNGKYVVHVKDAAGAETASIVVL